MVERDLSAAEKTARERSTPAAPMDALRCRAVFRIWPDFEISACINKSVSTVKADAALQSFSASGEGITWAVMDSGIDASPPQCTRSSTDGLPAKALPPWIDGSA